MATARSYCIGSDSGVALGVVTFGVAAAVAVVLGVTAGVDAAAAGAVAPGVAGIAPVTGPPRPAGAGVVVAPVDRTAVAGEMRAYYKITLTNATIVSIKDSGDGVNGTAQGDERERISFAYQKIVLTDLDSNTSAVDDWTSPG